MKKAKIIFLAFITLISTLFLFNQSVSAAKKVEDGTVMKKIKKSKELVVGT